jgi:hypothetical protein
MTSSAGGRVSAFGAALLIAACSAVLVIDTPRADALTQHRVTLSQSHPVFDGDFAGIAGSFEEATSAVTPTPIGCGNPDGTSDAENPPPFGTMCDLIPLRVVVPTNVDPADDFVVSIALSWTDSAGAATGQEGGVTDLDLHLYDNRQIERRTDPEGTYTLITSSNGTAIPEVVKVCCPDLGDYNIVIANVGPGANTSYHVHAEMSILKAEKIFELLADKPAAGHPASDDDNTLPADLSDVGFVSPGLAGLTPAEFDGDLSGFANAPLEAALLAPSAAPEAVRVSRPAQVSGVTLALWLSLLPLGIAGGAFGSWWRRRNAAGSLT